MTDIKISQLGSATSLSDSDLFAVSKSLGGSSWESKSISAESMLKAFASSSRSLKVALDGIRDASTIKDAIVLAVALNPTETDPVCIQVMPGTYYEDNPMTIPEWVSIYSEGGIYSAGVVANNDGVIFSVSGNSSLDGFTIFGSPAFSNTAYQSASTSTSSVIKDCLIENCYVGVLSDNGSVIANTISGLSLAKVFDKYMRATNGGFIVATNCSLNGIVTRPLCGFSSSGSGSELYLWGCSVNNCVKGLSAGQSGYIDVFSAHINDCDSAIHIGSTGSSHIKAIGCILEDSVNYDLFIESATARLSYSGHIDSSKFSIVSGAEVNIVADDENYDGGLITGSTSLQGKLSVGTPGAIALGEDVEVNMGEGSSFVNDKYGNEIVEYWSYDASAASGSRFTRFANNAGTQLTAANDAIIIGCKYPFPAIRLDVDVALTTAAGYLVPEYWDGSMWIDLSASAAPSGDPAAGLAGYRRSDFTKRLNQIFRNVETQFVEFSSALFSNGDWASDNDVLDEIPAWDAGDDFYAIRIRNNGALTTGMQFSDGLVKPHSFMVSTSGQKANFGLYRTDESLYVDSKLFYPDPTNPPSYTNLPMSTNITYPDLPTFLKANAVSKVAISFTIPNDIDTASPLYCYVDGAVTTTDIGNDMVTTMYIARVDSQNPGTIGSLPEVSVDQLTTVTTAANTFVSVVQDIDISSYRGDDLLLVGFARFATDPSDTFSGDFIIGDITFRYKSKFV